jgi:hypothetical protein
MIVFRSLFVFWALLAGFTIVGPASAQTTLRYKFKLGEKLHYTVEQSTFMHTPTGAMGMHAICDVAWEITAVDAAGNAKVDLKIERVQLIGQTPQRKMQIDSKDGKDPQGQEKELLGDLYAGFKGAEITMNTDSRGNVSEIHLPKALVAGARRVAAGVGMGESFNEDGLKRLFGLCGLSLPEGSIMKDQTWDHTVTIKFRGGNLKQDTKYTYQGQTERNGKKLETLSLKPSIKLEGGRVTTRITIKKLETQGTAHFDNASGHLVDVNVKQQTEFEIGQEGLAAPRTVETIMSWKLVDNEK